MNIGKLTRMSAIIPFKNKRRDGSFKELQKEITKYNLDTLYDWFNIRKNKYYRIGWAYLYNHYDVEDVFQNTIIKICESISQLREERYFETWVTAIFINECKRTLRNRQRVSTTGTLNEVMIQHSEDSHLELKEGLKTLEDIHRTVLVLKYISGYSQEEIAQILDIPIGTVKSRIYRGLRELRSNIEEVE